MLTAAGVVAIAVGLDLAVGEPPTAAHPVAWFGKLVDGVDREWGENERRQRAIGVVIAALVPLVPAFTAGMVVLLAATIHLAVGAVLAALVLFLSSSLRLLLELVRSVLEASERDLERARSELRGLAGRDAASLSPGEIRSAAVESAAENLADGFVAPVFSFALFAPISLPLAAAAAAWVKGVNTLDSMLGYRSKPIGTASARLDDVVMWLPARATAVCLALAARKPSAIRCASRWARVPSSPNSGWPMATLACVLAVRLEKPGAYVLNDANSDDGTGDNHPLPHEAGRAEADGCGPTLPTVGDGKRALTVVGVGGAIAVALAVGLASLVALLEVMIR